MMSKGETIVAKLLTQAGITYISEKTFTDLRNGAFRYDFYLPIYNILLEIDGQQHFEQVKQFQKTRSDFLKTIGHDHRKNDYALAHNIPLYRIPYWDFDKLNDVKDLFNEEYLVRTRYHNDNLTIPS